MKVYYLNNLQCDAVVSSLDIPRIKFFNLKVMDAICMADKLEMSFGKLPVVQLINTYSHIF